MPRTKSNLDSTHAFHYSGPPKKHVEPFPFEPHQKARQSAMTELDSTKIPKVAQALWWIGLAASFVAISARKLGDFDLPWHLAFGRLVVSSRSIPRVDDLAFTHPSIEYAEFLADTLLFAVMESAGPLGLQMLGGLLTLLIALILSRGWKVGPATRLTCSAAVAAASAWFVVRPATLSFVLIAWTVVALEVHCETPLSRKGRFALLSLVPLFALWANLHGFVVLGLALVVGYSLFRLACALSKGRFPNVLPPEEGTDMRWVGGAALFALLASMMNMAGPRLWAAPFQVLPDVGRVTEWAPTTFSFLSNQQPVLLLYAIVVGVAFLGGRNPQTQSRIPSLWEIGVLGLALVLATSAVRLLAPAAILVAPLTAKRLSGLVSRRPIMWLASGFSSVLLASWLLLRSGTAFGIGFEKDHFPEAAVQFIKDHRPKGRMWNSSVYGGFLSWHLYPEYRILMDGRTGWVHEPRLVSLASQSERHPEAFQQLDQEFGFQWGICRAFEAETLGAPLAQNKGWTMVFWDDVSAIYVKNSGENAQLMAQGYQWFRHLTPLASILDLALKGHRRDELVHDAHLAVVQAPDSPRGAFLEACAALAQGDRGSFSQALERLRVLSTNPGPVLLLETAWP